jgi:anti-anti-sigma factor
MLELQPYAFSIVRPNAYCVVRASGELDAAAVPGLRSCVHAAHGRADHVVVDLRDVSFMDSYALRGLAGLQEPAPLVIAGAGIQRVLDITGARSSLRWITPEQLAG